MTPANLSRIKALLAYSKRQGMTRTVAVWLRVINQGER